MTYLSHFHQTAAATVLQCHPYTHALLHRSNLAVQKGETSIGMVEYLVSVIALPMIHPQHMVPFQLWCLLYFTSPIVIYTTFITKISKYPALYYPSFDFRSRPNYLSCQPRKAPAIYKLPKAQLVAAVSTLPLPFPYQARQKSSLLLSTKKELSILALMVLSIKFQSVTKIFK